MSSHLESKKKKKSKEAHHVQLLVIFCSLCFLIQEGKIHLNFLNNLIYIYRVPTQRRCSCTLI